MLKQNPITIEALETIDAINRRGSFAKAAEELNKATSAVSYVIQKLEDQLDIAVFQRQGRRSVLTPAGELILNEGRNILASTKRLAATAKEVSTGWETHIRIGLESIMPYETAFKVLAEFSAQHPSIELDVRECVLNGGWELLGRNDIDLAIGAPGPAPKLQGFRSEPLTVDNLVPVIACHHPLAKLAGNPSALKAEIENTKRVIMHDTSTEGIRRSAGLSAQGRQFFVQNIDQKLQAILAGIGVSHLPRSRAQNYLDNGKLIELVLGENPQPTPLLAWRLANKGKGLGGLTKLLTGTTWL